MSTSKKPSHPEPPSPLPLKHKRRKRDDLMNRNYTCGCGKSYLSYPALYTHLKQKHNGKQPFGTILPSSLRGRKPKNVKEESNSSTKENEEGERNDEEKFDDFIGHLNSYSSFLKNNQVVFKGN